jgi:hypothetical protein
MGERIVLVPRKEEGVDNSKTLFSGPQGVKDMKIM